MSGAVDDLISGLLRRLQSLRIPCACELAVSGIPYAIDAMFLPETSEGRRNWRWQHCMSNCLMVSQCGGGQQSARCAEALSFIKEVIDLIFCLTHDPDGENCRSAFQPGDFEDNANGRKFGKQCNDSCEGSPLGKAACCHEKCTGSGAGIGAPDPPPGPFVR